MTKKIASLVLASGLCLGIISFSASAHSGRIDSNGEYYDRATATPTIHVTSMHTASEKKSVQTKKTGWVGKKYYDSGVLSTGWKTIEKKSYYFNSDGNRIESNCCILNKTFYTFDAEGVCIKKSKKARAKMYLTGPTYSFYGWVKLNNTTWYFYNFGEMAKDTELEIGSDVYKFDENGICIAGDVTKSVKDFEHYMSCYYYYEKNSLCSKQVGWSWDEGVWSYYTSDGKKARDISLKINKVVYTFDGSGTCTNPPDLSIITY